MNIPLTYFLPDLKDRIIWEMFDLLEVVKFEQFVEQYVKDRTVSNENEKFIKLVEDFANKSYVELFGEDCEVTLSVPIKHKKGDHLPSWANTFEANNDDVHLYNTVKDYAMVIPKSLPDMFRKELSDLIIWPAWEQFTITKDAECSYRYGRMNFSTKAGIKRRLYVYNDEAFLLDYIDNQIIPKRDWTCLQKELTTIFDKEEETNLLIFTIFWKESTTAVASNEKT